MSKKKKLVIALSVILCIVLVLHTAVYSILLKPNCIGFNCTPKINSSTTIKISQNDKEQTLKYGDAQFKKIKSILSRKIARPHRGIILGSYEYTVMLINGDIKQKYYCAFDGRGNDVTITLWDFAEGKDTAFALDFPYYIITKISMKEFKEIFPNFNENKFFSEDIDME